MRLSLGKWLLPLYVVIAFALLLTPIVHVIIYSFNDSRRNNSIWAGWTFDKWLNVCDQQGVCEAFGTSVAIGLVATLIATILGTLLAIAVGRYRFRGRGSTNLLLFLPMATPEVVLGAGLAAQFLSVGVSKGFWTVVIVHALFCLSFVVVTVKARVASLDPALEEAGRDLYGSAMQVFWRVTLPLLTPGIVAAALLSFALSFDDFIITKFNAGQVTTFPLWIYTKKTPPAEANVIAAAIFIVAIVAVVVVQLVAAARRKRLGITQ
ncbi:MAG: ABC transporter permease [Microbacteriaceae bacterium]|nr:ABC transporter permease [Microbacteriaceae bacterium]